MNIRITTTNKIVLSSNDYKGEFTLKKRDGSQKKMLISQTGAEKFADWFFATGKNIMIKPVNFVVAQEFKLDFPNKIKELVIDYTDENGVQNTETFNSVKSVFMKKADANGFVLKVDVDIEGQISGLQNNIAAQTQTQNALQSKKLQLEEEYNNLMAEIAKLNSEISALEGLIYGKSSAIEEAKAEIERLSAENKSMEDELIRLNEEKEKLQATEEVLTLDVGETKKTVDSIRERLADNQDSVELMDDLFKQKKPITSRIKDIIKDVEKVEKTLGLVARFQEKLAETINTAVADTDGNGTVDVLAESGGELLRGKLHSDEQGDQTASEST